MRRKDWLAQQLPMGMVEDEFLVRFLSIFQDVADTLFHQIDNLPHAFDSTVAPLDMVRTLGRWIGLDWVDPSLPDELQRRVVREYFSIVQWRGTRRGMLQLLEVVSGAAAVVEDRGGVFAEGEAPRDAAHVVLRVESSGWATDHDLLRIVRAELPAAVTFELHVGPRQVWPVVFAPPTGQATALYEEIY
jgi:phage tail-like protein